MMANAETNVINKSKSTNIAITKESQPLLNDQYDIECGAIDISNIISPAALRLSFLRRFYLLLSIQALFLTIVCGFVMINKSVQQVVIGYTGLLSFFVVVTSIGMVIFIRRWQYKYPQNLISLTVITLFQTTLLATICASFAATGLGHLILQAAIITTVTFFCLTAYAFSSEEDFSFLGCGVFTVLFALVVCTFSNVILNLTGSFSRILAFLISFLGSVVFSLFILFDTSQIIHMDGPDDVAFAALQLYLDIIDPFLETFNIMSTSERG